MPEKLGILYNPDNITIFKISRTQIALPPEIFGWPLTVRNTVYNKKILIFELKEVLSKNETKERFERQTCTTFYHRKTAIDSSASKCKDLHFLSSRKFYFRAFYSADGHINIIWFDCIPSAKHI